MKQMKSDLRPYAPVDTLFTLSASELRKARDQRTYLALSLSDRSGGIKGYLWTNPDEIAESLTPGMYVHLQGQAKPHNDTLIISIESIRRAGEEEVDISDFLSVVPGGVDLWMDRLREHIKLIKDTNCWSLVKTFFADAGFQEAFKTSPAGMTVHHNYIGGLLEHSVNTMSHAAHMAEKYPALLDRDLLLTGSLLHDIGKIREMTGGMTRTYTTEGKLLGHIPLGYIMLEERLHMIKGFPSDLGLLLKHMILSHHGNLEYGSPVRPATAEALALHHIENLDAKMNHLYNYFESCQPDQEWTPFDKFLSTEIYRGRYRMTLRQSPELEEAVSRRQVGEA